MCIHAYDSVNRREGLRGKYPAEWKFILRLFRFQESLISGDDMQPIPPYWFETDLLHCFRVCSKTHEFTFSRIGREPSIYEFLENVSH
jgi:hypothetical protein